MRGLHHSPEKEICVLHPLAVICSLLEPLEIPNPHSVSMELPTLDIVCKQNLW